MHWVYSCGGFNVSKLEQIVVTAAGKCFFIDCFDINFHVKDCHSAVPLTCECLIAYSSGWRSTCHVAAGARQQQKAAEEEAGPKRGGWLQALGIGQETVYNEEE